MILPQGSISEVFGPRSTGKTSLIHGVLANATAQGECCAVVDAGNAFDPLSAAQNGVELCKLLWIRGAGRADQALKSNIQAAFQAVDLLIHAGGFGVVVLDLCDIAPHQLNRIPLSYWYRFRLAVQNTPTRLIVAGDLPLAKSCARVQFETRRKRVAWKGPVLDGIVWSMEQRKGRQEREGQLERLPLAG